MKFIKKIYDFFANRVRQFQRERCPRGYARVSAKTLMDICECINPSYAHLAEYARQELGATHGWGGKMDIGDRFDSPSLADAFYNNREAFFASVADIPAFFYNYLIEKYSPANEEKRFQSMVEAAGLQQHVLLFNEGVHKAISFEKIMVEDNIKLNLGGKFRRWKFNCVKFCDAVDLNIYPPSFNSSLGGMVFSNNVCFGKFECWFFGVPHIYILGSKFMEAMILDVGSDVQLNAYGRVDEMEDKFLQSSAPAIEFSGNRFEKIMLLFGVGISYRGLVTNPNLGEVRFGEGNYIGDMALSHAIYPENKTNAKSIINSDGERAVKVREIHFDTHECIKMPSNTALMMHYKDFFINLKNRAIERRDREAEFGYARKERYFDRGLANRWQDKFILGWSHYVSDSGISWIRPIGWLIAVQAILAAAFIGWNVWICASDWSVGGWAKTVIESLDPLSKVESKCADSISSPLYNVARKIFLFLFLYEVIKVFRRFSK